MQSMQVDEALANADEWIKGVTLYEGAQGWRVACATLAAEVRSLRLLVNECAPHVFSSADAEHLLDGFHPKRKIGRAHV